ncbi:MAG: histidine kinase [Acidobacteriota bacterium]
MAGTILTDSYIIGDLIGFSAGLVITVLLAVLTLRAAKLPGTPFANNLLALCSLIWNLAGLARVFVLLFGQTRESQPAIIAIAIQFTSGAVWPILMLSIWRDFAVLGWQKMASRILQIFAFLSATVIVFSLWSTTIFDITLFSQENAKQLTSYNGSILLTLGAVVLLKSHLASRAVWFSSLTALFGVFGTTFTIIILNNFTLSREFGAALMIMSKQSVLLILLGAFFLFARFRFADIFIRYSFRILLASLLAVILVLIIDAQFVWQIANLTAYPRAAHNFAVSIPTTVLLLSFALLDRSIGILVNRWILRAPDYRNAARQLGERLRCLHSEDDIRKVVEEDTRKTLELDDISLITFGRLPAPLWPSEIHDGEILELDSEDPLRCLLSLPDIELLVPVRTGGEVTDILAISPGPARRGLVSHEVNYLRTVAAQFGSRLDLLRVEHEMIERQNREALLLQQVTEAEFRALRAQINPHFLFNSLNTIADLIVMNPSRAETMTLHLAKVFRHVLAHSARPLTSIREEIEFLRTYLQIEEARFGDRLQVEIDIAPEIAGELIPSLILQPLVENALKHGLAPKLGPGHLWISALTQGDQVYLKVEDDGVGANLAVATKANRNHLLPQMISNRRPPAGVGLTNIVQRLATLYQNRAGINFEPRESGGTRVTITLPRGSRLEDYEKSHS